MEAKDMWYVFGGVFVVFVAGVTFIFALSRRWD